MKRIKTSIRVRYSETDKMGFVYYGNYAQFFEVGRTEMFRSLDLAYTKLEEQGVMMPVVDLECKFKSPAFYDDLLEVETWLKNIPTGVRMEFCYNIRRAGQNKILVSGATTLVFMDMKNNKLVACPEFLKQTIEEKLFKEVV